MGATQALGMCKTSAPTLANNEPAPLRLDASGALVTTSTAAPPAPGSASADLAAAFRNAATLELVAKASSAVLVGFDLTSEGAAGYLQVHNLAAAPTPGAVPAMSWAIPASGTMVRDSSFFGGGKAFTTGLVLAWSSTRATYTAAAFTGTCHVLYT